MGKLILVCGPVGAGKTTYTHKLCEDLSAIRFSIDPWMQTLFSEDMTSLDYDWMIARVYRCYTQIWDVSQQILKNGGTVILDLGFTERKQRELFYDYAKEINAQVELHFLDIPVNIRKERVKRRNLEKDPAVYSFDVTNFMFDFMEKKFQTPDQSEIQHFTLIKYETNGHATVG